MSSAEQQLEEFIAKFTPEVASQTREALAKMRIRLPGAVELVYDNYNALAIGFSPTERTSDSLFSIAVFPRWVSLFFAKGAGLPDPEGLLQGTGNVVRHIVLTDSAVLDSPGIQRLMAQTLEREGRVLKESKVESPGEAIRLSKVLRKELIKSNHAA